VSGFTLSAESAPGYLAQRGFGGEFRCRELGGGISNVVVLAESDDSRMVLKQALPQLRVRDEWLAERSRIFRERDGLIAAAQVLPKGWVPQVLWSDDSEFLFAMEAFSPEARSWKDELMLGSLDCKRAEQAGKALGLTIRETWRDPELERRFGDQTAFNQLRTDPYYRTIARRHPDIADAVYAWIAEVEPLRLALTHGDWSPKNMVCDGDRMVFIDYECVHFGDPSYDAAFALNHLLLKAFRRPKQAPEIHGLGRVFFETVLGLLPAEAMPRFEEATMRHLAFLMLARIDGKSPVEYLRDQSLRQRVRRKAKEMIADRPQSLDAVFARLGRPAIGRGRAGRWLLD